MVSLIRSLLLIGLISCSSIFADGLLYYDPTNPFTIVDNGTVGFCLVSTGSVTPPSYQSFPSSTGTSMLGTSGTALTLTSLVGTGWIGINSPSLTLTKASAQFPVPCAGQISRLYVYVTGNLSTSSVNVRLNVNGTNSSLVISIPALTTGTFTDVTHLVNVAAGDQIQFEVSSSSIGIITGIISMQFKG